MAIRYSLVVATLGRKKELELLLHSLSLQTMDKQSFEVILVDQNADELLVDVIRTYSAILNLAHIRSGRPGLSYNRNLGVSFSRGAYIAVPDDDCTYYPDTLQKADEELKRLTEPDMLIGKVYNRQSEAYVFKKTPAAATQIGTGNFYTVVSSIALFFKKDVLEFDESFGIGGLYPSNEDGDIILGFLKNKKSVYYSPAIDISHPPYDARNMPPDKLYRYGIGFGAMCRKHLSLQVSWLFIKVTGYQFLMMLKASVCFDFTEAGRRLTALKGRLKGFFIYKPGLKKINEQS